MTTDKEDLAGRVLDHKYRLERRLGMGAFGAVYEATHLLGKATRAVKVIHAHLLKDPVASRLFLKEAQAVMRIETPRAVLVHDVDRDPDSGRLFIVMEMLRGETLRDYLRRESLPGRGLPVTEAVRIATGVCEALRAAHSRGVIHRDLKPSNVMMVAAESGPPEVKVVDFGIARLHSVTGTGETSTEIWTGAIGTPQYMSPEQCRGQDVDGRSDLYSLGVLLYEMLAGRLPFRSNTAQGYAMAHLTETPLPLATACPHAEIPAELDRLVLRLLAKKPEDRPRDAAEVLRALEAFLGPAGRTSAARAVPAAAPRSAGRRLRPWAPVALAGLAAAGLLAAWVAWRDSTPTPEQAARPAPDAVQVVVPVAPATAPDAAAPPDVAPPQVAAPEPPPPQPRTPALQPARVKTAGTAPRPERGASRPAAREPGPGAVPPPRVEGAAPRGAPSAATPAPPPAPAPAPGTRRASPAPKGSSDPWDGEFDELERETGR